MSGMSNLLKTLLTNAYTRFLDHQAPKEGNECNICMESIDSTNYAEYRLKNGIISDRMTWSRSK